MITVSTIAELLAEPAIASGDDPISPMAVNSAAVD